MRTCIVRTRTTNANNMNQLASTQQILLPTDVCEQEAIHVTAARAEVLEIESRSPMLSAFYGRKLDAAAKV